MSVNVVRIIIIINSFCERPKYWLCNLRQMANYTCSGKEICLFCASLY